MGKLTAGEILIQKLDKRVKKAIDQYGLIQDGDRIMIGVSGGKDSLALVELLGRRMQIFKPRFELVAAHITMSNISYQSDLEYLKNHAAQYNIPFVHAVTSFEEDESRKKSACFLCSWHRRKKLFDLASEYQCNKIALGHHQDDILHTLLLNQTFQGSFSTMPPLLEMERFDMKIIRPLCLCIETELIDLSVMREYKKQIKNCPFEKDSHRSAMKAIFQQLENLNPLARHSLWNSMTNIHADYLPKIKNADSKRNQNKE